MNGLFQFTSIANAQFGSVVDDVKDNFEVILDIINILLVIIVGVIFIFFFWGLGRYLRKGEELSDAKNAIVRGVLAIFVLTSFWGIIFFLRETFLGDVDNGSRTDIDTFRIPQGGRGGIPTSVGPRPRPTTDTPPTTPEGGSDNRPGGSDNRPGGGDNRPGGGDNRPGGGDNRPGGSDNRPGGIDRIFDENTSP